MANELGPLAALQYIQQQGAAGKQQYQQNQLAQLAPQIMSGDPQAFKQAYAIDPKAATQAQSTGDDMLRRIKGSIDFIDAAQTPEQKEAAYQQVRPWLDSVSPSHVSPPATFAEAEPLLEQARGRIAMLPPTSGASGQGVQSTYIDDQGQRVAVLRNGQTMVLGNNAAQNQIIDTGNGFYGVNKGNLQASPVMTGGAPQAQAAPTEADMQADIVLANQMIAAGIPSEQVDAFLQARGQRAGAPTAGGQQLTKAPPQVTPYQQAQLGISQQAADRANMQLQLAQRAADRADRADERAAQAQANKQSGGGGMKIAQLENVNRGLDRIDQAMKALDSQMVDTGPIDQYVQRYTPAGKELEAAIGGIQNSMLALTRVPGVGSQSDLEARIANLQYPSLSNYPEVNRRTLQNLRAFVQDIQRQIGQSGQNGAQQNEAGSSDFSKLWN